MYEIQKYEIQNLEGRIETGPVQFNDDWPGIFIRGDNSGYYALHLKEAIERLEQIAKEEEVGIWITIDVLKGLLSDLTSPIVDKETLRWLE